MLPHPMVGAQERFPALLANSTVMYWVYWSSDFVGVESGRTPVRHEVYGLPTTSGGRILGLELACYLMVPRHFSHTNQTLL